MNLHLTASSEGVNCIWLLWGWTSLRESCQLSDLHKSDSLARGITLILLGSSTKHSSFIIQHVEEVGLLQMFLMESANIAKSERQSCQKFWQIAIPQKRRYTLQPYCKTANKSSKEFWKFAPKGSHTGSHRGPNHRAIRKYVYAIKTIKSSLVRLPNPNLKEGVPCRL